VHTVSAREKCWPMPDHHGDGTEYGGVWCSTWPSGLLRQSSWCLIDDGAWVSRHNTLSPYPHHATVCSQQSQRQRPIVAIDVCNRDTVGLRTITVTLTLYVCLVVAIAWWLSQTSQSTRRPQLTKQKRPDTTIPRHTSPFHAYVQQNFRPTSYFSIYLSIYLSIFIRPIINKQFAIQLNIQ